LYRGNAEITYAEGDYMEFVVAKCQNTHGVFFIDGTLPK
jgi:hypothetical protein